MVQGPTKVSCVRPGVGDSRGRRIGRSAESRGMLVHSSEGGGVARLIRQPQDEKRYIRRTLSRSCWMVLAITYAGVLVLWSMIQLGQHCFRGADSGVDRGASNRTTASAAPSALLRTSGGGPWQDDDRAQQGKTATYTDAGLDAGRWTLDAGDGCETISWVRQTGCRGCVERREDDKTFGETGSCRKAPSSCSVLVTSYLSACWRLLAVSVCNGLIKRRILQRDGARRWAASCAPALSKPLEESRQASAQPGRRPFRNWHLLSPVQFPPASPTWRLSLSKARGSRHWATSRLALVGKGGARGGLLRRRY